MFKFWFSSFRNSIFLRFLFFVCFGDVYHFKNIRIYFIYLCIFAKTIILFPSLMQSFNLTRFADPACCTVPKRWTPPTPVFHPPQNTSLYKSSGWSKMGSCDRWKWQDHGWHQWFPKQRTPKDPIPYEVHDSSHFHFKNKNSHDFLILSLSSLIPFTPTLDTLHCKFKEFPKTPFWKDSLATYAAFVQWFI